LAGNPNVTVRKAYEGTTRRLNGRANWTGIVRPIPSRLEQPLHWNKPRRIFVNSMSDLFHEDVPTSYIRAVADVMERADWHTYQVLTKRAWRLREVLNHELRTHAVLDHVWWGVSVENRRDGFPRIDALREASAVVRFLSIEPLLEDLGDIDLSGIHWVIVGGESGPSSRPMQPAWVESIRNQCAAAGVAFFFKQWGSFGPQDGQMRRLGKKTAGRLLDGRTWDDYPEVIQP
jgi:protein gp37